MGNRQTFDALVSQRIHPVPETLRVLGVQSGKRHGRQFVGAAKYDVTVQIADIVSRGGVFVGHKGREVTGVIVLLSRIDDVRPGAAGHTDRHFFGNSAGENPRQSIGDK